MYLIRDLIHVVRNWVRTGSTAVSRLTPLVRSIAVKQPLPSSYSTVTVVDNYLTNPSTEAEGTNTP